MQESGKSLGLSRSAPADPKAGLAWPGFSHHRKYNIVDIIMTVTMLSSLDGCEGGRAKGRADTWAGPYVGIGICLPSRAADRRLYVNPCQRGQLRQVHAQCPPGGQFLHHSRGDDDARGKMINSPAWWRY